MNRQGNQQPEKKALLQVGPLLLNIENRNGIAENQPEQVLKHNKQ